MQEQVSVAARKKSCVGRLKARRTLGTNAHLILSVVLEETLDTAAGKLNVVQ